MLLWGLGGVVGASLAGGLESAGVVLGSAAIWVVLFGGLVTLLALAATRDRPLLEHCRVQEVDLHGNLGLRVVVAIAGDYLERGERVEITVQLRTPQGAWLRGRRPPFQDPQGRFRAAQVSPPYDTSSEGDALEVALAFPFGALDLLATGEDREVVAEVHVFDGEEVVARQELDLVVPCRASIFPSLEVDAAGVDLVAVSRPEVATCRVCGDELAGPVRACPACDTPHHPECWEYNAGCSTFGCRGVSVRGRNT
jgi:hypothetical protein